VVYMSFDRQVHVTVAHLEELAHGLVDSDGLGERRLHLLDAANARVGLVTEPAHTADDGRGSVVL